MNLVFFAHPAFLGHQSMPRFARMLADGMSKRGHHVEIWSPPAVASKLPAPGSLKKWLGYFDQYLVFPAEVHSRLKGCSPDTLFVFTDQALGPWVPLVADRPHVIHCHDFLAQRSALGEIPENPTSWTGRQYQAFIRRGYTRGKNFISVSEKTKQDLHQFLTTVPHSSTVVYNGLNQAFAPQEPVAARAWLTRKTGLDLAPGYLLHIGGNQWYKNRVGVIELYSAWRATGGSDLPLLLLGEAPTAELLRTQAQSPFHRDIHWLGSVDDEFVRLAYVGASVFLFPSLAEGFGWPIAEAMASGCPVVTTDEAPMTEVAGKAGFLIARRPEKGAQASAWATEAAHTIHTIMGLSDLERQSVVEAGLENAARFNPELALNQIEAIYQGIL